MHIYSVFNKLFTTAVIEPKQVSNNTNAEKNNFQDENKEKNVSAKSETKSREKFDKSNVSGNRLERCFVSFPKNGDTLAVLHNKEQKTFKLADVEAYEKGVRWNKQAVRFLKETIEKKSVFLNILNVNKDGETVVEVYLDKEKTVNVNKLLLEQDFIIDTPKVIEPEIIAEQVNNEVLEVKPKMENNNLWDGIPENMDDMPMMPDDEYFWQSQIDEKSISSENNHVNIKQDITIKFNPFVNPPIEPLSVYPNGVKPNGSINNPLIDETPVFDEIPLCFTDNEIISSDLSISQDDINNITFNPFVNPPIEPLDVYANTTEKNLSTLDNNTSVLTSTELLEVKPLENEVKILLAPDIIIENVNTPLIKKEYENTIEDSTLPKTENLNSQTEERTEKKILKLGSKGKINLPQQKDEVELALEKLENNKSPVELNKSIEVLPEPLVENKIDETNSKIKVNTLAPEYDPFLDTNQLSNSDNIDALSMLDGLDSLGEVIVHAEEKNNNSKKRKFGK